MKRLCAILIVCLSAVLNGQQPGGSAVEWPYVGGDQAHTKYSALDDVNLSNVGEQVWPTQPIPHNAAGVPMTPLCATYIELDDPERASLDRITEAYPPEVTLSAYDPVSGEQTWQALLPAQVLAVVVDAGASLPVLRGIGAFVEYGEIPVVGEQPVALPAGYLASDAKLDKHIHRRSGRRKRQPRHTADFRQ